jgi:hypothetical protein
MPGVPKQNWCRLAGLPKGPEGHQSNWIVCDRATNLAKLFGGIGTSDQGHQMRQLGWPV